MSIIAVLVITSSSAITSWHIMNIISYDAILLQKYECLHKVNIP